MNQLVKDKAMHIITGFLKFSGISMSKMLFTKFPWDQRYVSAILCLEIGKVAEHSLMTLESKQSFSILYECFLDGHVGVET
jgi:hypothetical protein